MRLSKLWELVMGKEAGHAAVHQFQFSSVAQPCPTLCNHMNRSTPGLPVHHHLPEFTHTHVHRVHDAIQSTHPLLSLILPPSIFSSIRDFFPISQFSQSGQSIGVSASASVFPMNNQDWLPIRLTGLLSLWSNGLPIVFSNSTVQKHPFFSTESFFMVQLTSIHDYWKNHSFD